MRPESPYRWIEQARTAPAPIRFPFKATINDREAIVWPDWIEYPEAEDPYLGSVDTEPEDSP